MTVEVPLLCHHLYEAEFDSQMCHVFDAGKMRVAVFDAFPKAVTLDKVGITANPVASALNRLLWNRVTILLGSKFVTMNVKGFS